MTKRSVANLQGMVGALLFAVLTGCGPDTGGRLGVSGTVTFQGKPLATGTIEFSPTDAGGSPSGTTITAGAYSVPAVQGLLPGSYTVKISSVEGAAQDTTQAPGDSTTVVNKELIPAEFNSASTLKAEVSASATSFDFTIP